MARPADTDLLLRRLTALGGASGNTALMRELDWAPDKYWSVRDKLLGAGLVVKGGGRGGSVQLADAEMPLSPPLIVSADSSESTLYEPFAQTLRTSWKNDLQLTHCYVEVTAHQGRRPTGTWTRPDITVVSQRVYDLIPQPDFDVWTFELKALGCQDIKAVFEALSHGSRATRSVLALAATPEPDTKTEEFWRRSTNLALEHQIGLLVFYDARDFDTWNFFVAPPRRATAPDQLEAFLHEQLTPQGQEKLRSWRSPARR